MYEYIQHNFWGYLGNLNMRRKLLLTKVQRNQIVILHYEDYKERQISGKLKCSKTAWKNAIVKHRNAEIFCDRKRSRNLRETLIKNGHAMQRVVRRSPTRCRGKVPIILHSKRLWTWSQLQFLGDWARTLNFHSENLHGKCV